jgi:hypothetical protein
MKYGLLWLLGVPPGSDHRLSNLPLNAIVAKDGGARKALVVGLSLAAQRRHQEQECRAGAPRAGAVQDRASHEGTCARRIGGCRTHPSRTPSRALVRDHPVGRPLTGECAIFLTG